MNTKDVDMACLKAIFMYGEAAQTAQIDNVVYGTTLPVYDWTKVPELSASLTTQIDLAAKIDPGTPCCLVYTSGTTGMPKAVILSHDNCCFMARGSLRVGKNKLGVEYTQERILSYLPLSHVAGFQVDIILPIVVTACTRGFVTTFIARPYDLKEGSLK